MQNFNLKFKIFNFTLLFFILIFAFSIFNTAFAQDSGLVICGVGDAKPCTICDIWALADKVINFLLFTLATPILIVVLIAGGFIYLTSGGNPKKTETAKGLITSAIVGIIIAFAAWLVVDTILKTLVKGDFTIAWQEIEECPNALEPEPVDLSKLPRPPLVVTQGNYTDQEARDILLLAGVRLNKENCENAFDTNCTSLDGIPRSAINYLLEVNRRCVANKTVCQGFIVTGGTEAGHITHEIGKSVFDIATEKLNPTAQDYKTLRDMAKSAGAIPNKTFC